MKWFRHNPTPSEKSQDDPPPYGDNPLSAGEKISPSNSVDTVASGPPLISGKQWNYWVDWSEQPHGRRWLRFILENWSMRFILIETGPNTGHGQSQSESTEWLKNHDFRNALSPKNIKIAEIDRRTASGRCKKVVVFRRGDLYGNDMTGQRVEAWKDEFTESFGAFIEPVLSWQRDG
ncbi:hypothetical protein NCS55_00447700 [Fusarium keratoplasticum]|nr:hypothetical protein NCS55_00447700 [Fusarium keratoplasticum]